MEENKPESLFKVHAGRYDKEKYAESYAAVLREHGDEVKVEPVTVYDVWVMKRSL